MTTLNELYRPWAVDNARWGVEITQGEYKDAVIQIEGVEFKDDTSGELQVDFHIVNFPDGMVKEDFDKSNFVELFQLIISDILSKAIEDYKETNGN